MPAHPVFFRLTAILLFTLIRTICFSQNIEFEASKNGLIYPDSTVKQLKFIVDSLNLKFRICDLRTVYFAKLQAKAHFIYLQDANSEAVKTDMDAGMTFGDFIKKYDKSETDEGLLVIKSKYKDDDGLDVTEFMSLELNDRHEHEFSFDTNLNAYDKPLKGKWLYEVYGKKEAAEKTIRAFYFLEEFTPKALPEKYARMVQYSECLVDTSTQVFYEKARDNSRRRWSEEKHPAMDAFMDYVHTATGKPEFSENGFPDDYDTSLRFFRIDSLRKKDGQFNVLFREAIREALEMGYSGDEFEEYVGRFYSPETELELKRSRIVYGSCSHDDRPRVHALNIAKLSAQTVHWEIFLRSHLDIMNDRFERHTDGSYAWSRRKTYIRELEVLDIKVQDLLLGISLRIENPGANHYFGSIPRIGRALSESEQAAEIESQMLQMISDPDLDDYNRILMYYLFRNYNYHLEDEGRKSENEIRLKKAVTDLPDYLETKIDGEK